MENGRMESGLSRCGKWMWKVARFRISHHVGG